MPDFKSTTIELDFKELNIIKHALRKTVVDRQLEIKQSSSDLERDAATKDLVDEKLLFDRIDGTLDQFYKVGDSVG